MEPCHLLQHPAPAAWLPLCSPLLVREAPGGGWAPSISGYGSPWSRLPELGMEGGLALSSLHRQDTQHLRTHGTLSAQSLGWGKEDHSPVQALRAPLVWGTQSLGVGRGSHTPRPRVGARVLALFCKKNNNNNTVYMYYL